MSYYFPKLYRLMTNSLGIAPVSITIVTHYRPHFNYCENAIFNDFSFIKKNTFKMFKIFHEPICIISSNN